MAVRRGRRKSLREAYNSDLSTLDGALNGRETLVALGHTLVTELGGLEGAEKVSAARELRQVMVALRAGADSSGDGISGMLDEFGAPSLGDPA